MLKHGEDAYIEATYMKTLGPKVCPRVLGEIDSANFIMEYLPDFPVEHYPEKLCAAYKLLDTEVWWRPSVNEPEWYTAFTRRFHFTAPAWVDRNVYGKMIHGDPTAANVRLHLDEDGKREVRILDPKPPGRGIPSLVQVDQGKMLQSMMGWETALAQGDVIEYDWPFGEVSDEELRRIVFWCAVHFMRIAQREQPNGRLLPWAQECARRLMELCW